MIPDKCNFILQTIPIGVYMLYVKNIFQSKNWLKNVLWSTMSKGRVTNFAILSIEQEYARICSDKFIDKFAEVSKTKIMLLFISANQNEI